MNIDSISVKTISSTVVATVALLTSMWAIDNHYASAADVTKIQKSLETQVRVLRQERVEDELFKLDIKKQTQGGKLSVEDEALYQRYTRKLTETIREQRISDTESSK